MGGQRPPSPAEQIWRELQRAIDEGRADDVLAYLDRLYTESSPWLNEVVRRVLEHWRTGRASSTAP